MVDTPNYESLTRRVKQLELLCITLLLSNEDDDNDEIIYELQRFFRRSSKRDIDFREIEFLLSRGRNRNIGAKFESTLFNQVNHLEIEIESLKNKTELLQAETHSMLALQAMGIPDDQVKSQRFVPVRAYIDETPDGAITAISNAIKEVLSAYGFEVADEFPEIKGSWFKKWFVKSKDTLSRPEVTERLDKVERAIDLQVLNRPQADIDEKQSAAIANLIKALDNVPNAAIQSGSVLVVKLTTPNGSVIQARTLSQDEMVQLENNQLLLQDPSKVLYELSAACLNSRKQSS